VCNSVDAVTIFCTNLVAAHRVEFWEEKFNVRDFDTITTVIWERLRLYMLLGVAQPPSEAQAEAPAGHNSLCF